MGIQNIPRTYPEILSWSTQYESRAMIPSTTSHDLAETTTSLLIYYVPSFLKPLAKKLIIGLMDDRLREAMIYKKPERWVGWVLGGFWAVRKVYLRNFALPRTKPIYYTEEEKNEFGKYNICYADNEVPPSLPSPAASLCNGWRFACMYTDFQAMVSPTKSSRSNKPLVELPLGDSESESGI